MTSLKRIYGSKGYKTFKPKTLKKRKKGWWRKLQRTLQRTVINKPSKYGPGGRLEERRS